jgi:peptidoglycan/LPS O-acetylase OafA/YrhL
VVRRLRVGERSRRVASASAAGLPLVIAAGLLLGELAGAGRGGAVIVLFPLLVGTLAIADRGPAMILSAPWAVHGGHLSYALYLVHIPLFEVYWLALRMFGWLAPDSLLAHLVGLAVLGLTVPVAALGYRLVEEPARRRMKALLPARPPAGGDRDPDADTPTARFAPVLPRHAATPGRRASLVSALIATQGQPPLAGCRRSAVRF